MGHEGVVCGRGAAPRGQGEPAPRLRCSLLHLCLSRTGTSVFSVPQHHFLTAGRPLRILGFRLQVAPGIGSACVLRISDCVAPPCPWAASAGTSVEGETLRPHPRQPQPTRPLPASCTPGSLGQAVGVSRGERCGEGKGGSETGSLCSTGLSCGQVQSENPQEAAWAVPGYAARSVVRPGGGWGMISAPKGSSKVRVWAQAVPGEAEKRERWSGHAFPQHRQAGIPQLWKGRCRTFLRGAWTEGT